MIATRTQHRPFAPWALVLLLMVLAIGCPRDTPPPDNALESPEALRAAVDARINGVQDVRFHDVTLEYFGDGERVRVRQLILVQQPDRLRVQTRLPGSDEILSLLVSDGETFALHERDHNKYYTGAPSRENINRLIPVDLSGHDVVRVMLGAAPWDRFDVEDEAPQLTWDRRRGLYSYEVRRGDGSALQMYVRHTDFAVVEVTEESSDGEMIYSYTTDGWSDEGPLALPSFHRFQWPARDLDFSITTSRLEFNVDLPLQLFVFAPPPGSEVIELH